MLGFKLFVIFISFYCFTNIEANDCVSKKQPHIILILADDMGWNDVSFHGSNQIPTPNIDALAYNGVILNKHYVLPICTPSRSSLLTGLHALKSGMQGIPLRPGELRGVPLKMKMLPEHLRKLGYGTHLVGKWHIGYYTPQHTPSHRGFDSFYGYYNGYIRYYNHSIDLLADDFTFHRGHDLHRDDPEKLTIAEDSGYFTDLITEEAEKIISNNGNDKPLFLQINHLACHSNGDADDPLEVPDMQKVNETFHYIKDITRRKYAGVMKSMDDSIGRVVTALSKARMLEDSIIIFMSDNGAPTVGFFANTGSNYPLRGIKESMFEGASRGAACIFSPLIKSPSRVSEEMMHIVDWLPTLYSVAGGNVEDLGNKIDGFNQWPSISEGAKSPRDSLIVNINELTNVQGAIIGKHKLVKGALKVNDGFYGFVEKDETSETYRIEDTLSSPAGVEISRLPGFGVLAANKMQNLRSKSTLQCTTPKSYPDCSTLCLFDLEKDPCETVDISKEQPEVIKNLESLLDYYRKDLLPQSSTITDPLSYPEHFHNTWMPWKTAEIASS